jgi:hypothetical protein
LARDAGSGRRLLPQLHRCGVPLAPVWNLRSGGTDTLIEPEQDPASLTELFATGSDSMVFSIREESALGTFQRDYTGFDRLTGETVTVDGRELEVTEFAYEYGTPEGPRQTEGNQFVHEGWRLFFGGLETVTLPDGETFEANYSPMEFAEPGESGFLTMQPLYDCGDMMSALDDDTVWRVADDRRLSQDGRLTGHAFAVR